MILPGYVHDTPASKKYLSSWRNAGMSELITPGSGASPSLRTQTGALQVGREYDQTEMKVTTQTRWIQNSRIKLTPGRGQNGTMDYFQYRLSMNMERKYLRRPLIKLLAMRIRLPACIGFMITDGRNHPTSNR